MYPTKIGNISDPSLPSSYKGEGTLAIRIFAQSMKTLHKFVIKSYIGPFFATLFISMFILIMQFLWKYIDDLVGKGLEWTIIGQLLFYASATFVPMALPLGILLSSIMTFGNLSEHYELAALKSSGLSLTRIMYPLIVVSILLSIGAFYFSDQVLPRANLKMGSLLYDVREQKAALQINEGVFYNGINGYSIRVGKKEDDGKLLKDLMIYDHTDYQGNTSVTLAESGTMQMSADKQYLILTLRNGNNYEEQLNTAEQRITRPLLRTQFEEQIIRLDMSGFKLNRTDEDLFKGNYEMLMLNQLEYAIDSLKSENAKIFDSIPGYLSKHYYISSYSKTKAPEKAAAPPAIGTFDFKGFDRQQKQSILETALSMARSTKGYLEIQYNNVDSHHETVRRCEVEWHRKFTLSFSCLLLFFIGAPLGAIIRRGGIGLPGVISVLFFILLYVLSITGEKFVKQDVLPAWQGMWMPSAVLLPISLFLTYKAAYDSALFDMETYVKPFRKLFKRGS